MRIEIESGEIIKRNGKIKSGDRAGQDWEIRTQEAYVYNGHAHPERIMLTLPNDFAGYPPGSYLLGPESFIVGDFKALTLAKTLTLVRETEAPKLAKVG